MNTQLSLSLIVLRSGCIESSKQFFQKLGVSFHQEKHGNGPTHYVGQLNQLVIEIYPRKQRTEATTSKDRLGFSVKSLSDILGRFEKSEISGPKKTQWGTVATLTDPDGRKIDLIETHPS